LRQLRDKEKMNQSANPIKTIAVNIKIIQLLLVDFVSFALVYIPAEIIGYETSADAHLSFAALFLVSPLLFVTVYIYHFVVYIKRGAKIAAAIAPIYLINFLIVSYIIALFVQLPTA
jgi:hypothetical protein